MYWEYKMLIRIEGLVKKLQNKEVLKKVNLTVKEGEILVVMGRSGCGKSVLLKHIAGLFKPDAGSIFIHDIDICKLDPLMFHSVGITISMLFQNSALFDSMNVRENVGFYIDRYSTLNETEKNEKVKEKLALVDLKDVEYLKPYQLSGGMQKRVALARSLMMEPEIMLYDEPTTGLDPITADSINKLIRNLNEKFKMTSIVVTHDIRSAFQIADRLAMLHDGYIIFEGTPEEMRNSSNPYIQQFLAGSYEESYEVK